MAKRSRFRPSLKRARTWCVVAAAALCAMIMLSAHWRFVVGFITPPGPKERSRTGVELEGGALILMWQHIPPGADPATSGFVFEVDRRWQDDVTLAWRPYHVAQQPGFALLNTHHGLVLPLWLVAVPVTIAAAYLQGVVAGQKRADKGRCAGCGVRV
ncbi:MAG: hypothetical protein QM783_03460 [Phycisphaerales bacterium]